MSATARQIVFVSVVAVGVSAAAGYYTWQARNVRSTQEAFQKTDEAVKVGWSDIEKDWVELSNSPIIKGIRTIQDPLAPTTDALTLTKDATESGVEEAAKRAQDAAPTMLPNASTFVKAANTVRALKNGDYGKAEETALGILVDLLVESSKEIQEAQRNIFSTDAGAAGASAAETAGAVFTSAAAAKDLGIKWSQLLADLATQTQLISTRTKLYTALKRAKVQNEAQHIQQLNNKISAAFQSEQDLFTTHNIRREDVEREMINNTAGPQAAERIARGITILDPEQGLNDLARIPMMNPDFIAAMQAENFIAAHARTDARWLRFSATQYPDGIYIPAFGSCRGIDIPNPISGGIIASSTAACRALGGSTMTPAGTADANPWHLGAARLGEYSGKEFFVREVPGEWFTPHDDCACGIVVRGVNTRLGDKPRLYARRVSKEFTIGDGSEMGPADIVIPFLLPGEYLLDPLIPRIEPLTVSVHAKRMTVVNLATGNVVVTWSGEPLNEEVQPYLLDGQGKGFSRETRAFRWDTKGHPAAWHVGPGEYTVQIMEHVYGTGLLSVKGNDAIPITVNAGQTMELKIPKR